MDYDNTEIAASYDKARVLAPETVRLWRQLLSMDVDQTGMSLVIDVGCGTGRFSEILATHFGCQVIGIDPSHKMVEQARRKSTTEKIDYRQGAAEAIPLPTGCADLVFISNVYHHLNDPLLVARECRRILRPCGFVCIRNSTRERDFPYRHFFPGLDQRIDTELPSQQDIESVFVGASFVPLVHRLVTQVVAPDWLSFVAKCALRGDSFLVRLSEHDFEYGMAALRSPGEAINQDDPVTEEIDWFVFVSGTL